MIFHQMLQALSEPLHYGFFRRSLLAVVLLAPMLSMLGCLVVEARMAYFSDAVGHGGLAGIALGALVGIVDPFLSLVTFSVMLALAVVGARRKGALSSDTAIGVFQAAAMAVGVVLLSRGGGFARYSRFLVGDILSIGAHELWRLAAVFAVFLVVWIWIFNRVLVASLGETLAHSRKISPWFTLAVFSVVVAVVVASTIQWLGILVIQALVVLPAATARNLARSMAGLHWIAVAVGTGCSVAGLFASWAWSTASGATMVLFCFGAFLVSLVFRR
ncbi:MAG: metal ABC transporter permease [Fibrobacteres bacterium]|nr:metal ABC transporter permease [Fibrobacterota bacterium]